MFPNLRYDLKNVLNCFKKSMKTNLVKFQIMVLGVNYIAPLSLDVTCKIIPCFSEVKLFGITLLIISVNKKKPH